MSNHTETVAEEETNKISLILEEGKLVNLPISRKMADRLVVKQFLNVCGDPDYPDHGLHVDADEMWSGDLVEELLKDIVGNQKS